MERKLKNKPIKVTLHSFFFPWIGSCLLVLIATLFSCNHTVHASDLQPGEVRLSKTAKPVADMVNQWDVTVRVEGRNHFPPPSTDIVLVIDMSNSMVPSSTAVPPRTKDRLALAKEAAKKFTNQVLKEGYENKISLVTYESDVKIHTFGFGGTIDEEFIDPEHRQLLLDRIDSLSIDLEESKKDPYKGGTFTQGAIRKSTNQLEKSSALNRDIVLISDGVPTFNYDIKSPYNQKDRMEHLVDKKPSTYNYYSTKKDIPEEYYDYSKRIGEGKNYTSKAPDNWGIPTGKDRIMTNSAYAALDEAGFSEAKKYQGSATEPLITEFYTIGLDLNEEGDEFEMVGQDTLKGIASSEDNYFDTSSDDLENVLSGIGGKIIGAIKSADVIDPMGKGFKLTNKKVVQTQGEFKIVQKNEVETIQWDLDALITPISNQQDEDIMYAEMTYRVDATEEVIKEIDKESGLAPTNGVTSIEYIAYDRTNNFKEKKIKSEFIVPKVHPTIVSLEKKVVDIKGKELNFKNEKFKFSIGDDIYTESDVFEVYATDRIQLVHPWEANKLYSIGEQLLPNQEYKTSITINGEETSGTTANFSFIYDSISKSYAHQEIVVTNKKIVKLLHIRQTVIEANDELVIPSKGYYFGIDTQNERKTLNFISGSTTKNTSNQMDKKIFTTYKFELDPIQTMISVRDIVPEYYQFYGYIVTNSSDKLASEHVSSNTVGMKKDREALLDYTSEDEYWLTMFIRPKFNDSENSPRPYSWNYQTNQFGK